MPSNPVKFTIGTNLSLPYPTEIFNYLNRSLSSPNFPIPVPLGSVQNILTGNSDYLYDQIRSLISERRDFGRSTVRHEIVLCISSLLFNVIHRYITYLVSNSRIHAQGSIALVVLSVTQLQEIYNFISRNVTPHSVESRMLLQTYQRRRRWRQERPYSRLVLSLLRSAPQPIVILTRNGIHASRPYLPYTTRLAVAGNFGAVANISSRRNSSRGLTVERIEKFKHFEADESLAGEQCCICLGDIEVGKSMVRLDCEGSNGKHILCVADANKWFADNKTCPLCRHDFS